MTVDVVGAHRSSRGVHRVPTEVPTAAEIRRNSVTITAFTWVLTGAVVVVSMSTAAPFIDAHSSGWGTGPVMALAVDGCFILALQADGTLARFEVSGGRWPFAFRWVTGLSTVWLNIGAAALAKDLVGVAIHLIPPLLLLLVAEAGPAYRRRLARLARRPARKPTTEPVTSVPEPVGTPAPTTPEPVPTTSPEALTGPIPEPLPALWNAPEWLTPGPVVTPTAHPVPTTPGWVPTPAEEVPTPAPEDAEPEVTSPARLGEEDAARVIEECWRQGLSHREAARRATRASSFVGRVYKRLDEAERATRSNTDLQESAA